MSNTSVVKTPSTSDSPDRDAKGLFKPGHKIGGGVTPYHYHIKELQKELRTTVDPVVFKKLLDQLINIAYTGNNKEKLQAINEIFDRVLGKPKQTIEADIITTDITPEDRIKMIKSALDNM